MLRKSPPARLIARIPDALGEAPGPAASANIRISGGLPVWHDKAMSQNAKPSPPKPCPICHVAMQATAKGAETVHRCERCSLTLTVKTSPSGRER